MLFVRIWIFCKGVSVILVCGVPISSALVSSPLDTSAVTVLTSWLLQSFGDSSLFHLVQPLQLICFGSIMLLTFCCAASAIDMLRQHCVVECVCIVLPLQLICFGSPMVAWDRLYDWYALEVSSWSSFFWRSSCFASSWLSGFDFHLCGFFNCSSSSSDGVEVRCRHPCHLLLGCSFAVL